MSDHGFFYELKRRRVWRVTGAYVLVVWMAVEIVLETAPVLGLPEWLPRAVVVLAFVGFPVTLVLAWVFDVTAHGVVRTPSLEEATPSRPTTPTVPAVVSTVAGERARLAGVFGAGVIVALVGFGAYSAIQPVPAVRPEAIQAVAVLPLSDLSPGGDQTYFANGITEELINRLARVPELSVVGRTTAFALRQQEASLADIVRELGVEAVVEGSVHRSGDRLRVNVELVDARTGFQLWSDTYDRTVDDIFAIQDEVATAIVDALKVQLDPGSSWRRAGTESIRAHDAYLLGLSRWHARTEPDLQRALEYFQTAITEDPSYAPARAGLALTYAVLPLYSDIATDVATDRGLEAAARALALDASNAEAHAAIGQIAQALEWNLEAAEMAYRRALEVQPSYATAHQWYGETLLLTGRLEEARQEISRAIELDPLSVAGRYVEAYLLLARRDLPAARSALIRLLRPHPDFVFGHAALVDLCLAIDCHDDALDALAAAYPDPIAAAVSLVVRADAAMAAGRDGAAADRARALQALEPLLANGTLRPARVALFRAALDDRDGALDAITRAYDEGTDPDLLFALVHPLFDPIRRDARFTALTRALGVEAPAAALAVATPAGSGGESSSG